MSFLVSNISFFESNSAKNAIKSVESGRNSLVIISAANKAAGGTGGDGAGGEILSFDERGIKTLLFLFENQPETLKDAVVFDKVIGKAAACVLALAGVRAVYGAVTSAAGHDFLSFCGVPHAYGLLTEKILNRTGDDFCPIEKASLAAATPLEGYILIKKRLGELAAKQSAANSS